MRKRNYSSSNLCIIYALHNNINNKIYIGQTWRPLHVRWNSGNGYNQCTHIQRAINKYGKENFYYEVLIIANTQKLADYWEGYFIQKYDSSNHKNGYNLNLGGTNHKHSLETINRMSEAQKGKPSPMKGKTTPDHVRYKQSVAAKGRVLSLAQKEKLRLANIGRIPTEETRQKISLSHKKREKKLSIKDIKALQAARKAKPLSEKSRQKMSDSHKGITPSQDNLKKRSRAMKGRTWKLIDGKRVWSKLLESK